MLQAQTTIAIQDFETVAAAPIWSYVSSGGSVSTINTGTPANARVRNGASSFQVSNAAGMLTFEPVSLAGYDHVKIIVHLSSISGTASNGADGPDYVRLFAALNGNAFLSNTEANADIAVNGNSNSRWSYNNSGATTNAGTNTTVAGAAGTNQGTIQSTLTVNIPDGTSSVALRVNMLNNDVNEIWCVDDIEITGTPVGVTAITVLSAVSLFSSVTGVPSSYQSYTVSGTALTGNIAVSAPAGFEISTASGTGYGSSLALTPTAGTVAATTIFVRMNSSVPGNNSGIISHTSTGASTQNISVTGIALAEEPNTSSSVSFTNILSNSMTVNFSGGNGSSRIVVFNSGGPVSAIPTDGNSYNANSVFGNGAAITPGQYVVYNGGGNSVTVTGLAASTNYNVAVFEYNDAGLPAATNYLATPGTGSQLTPTASEGLQLTTPGLLYKLDFDNTVAGVNNGQFAGTGFTTSPLAGQLNSNTWAMTGWTDGALAFGGTRTTAGSDYTRGSSNGGVSTGGVYAFATTTGNASLGFQPGGGDWAPGTVTLKVQNQTGSVINSLQLSYKLYVLNDQGRSSSFNCSWSGDNTNFTDLVSLNYSSPAAADIAAGWTLNERAATITGLTITPGAFFFLRWNGADAGGTGTRDEFALDDIAITANPNAPISLPVTLTNLKAVKLKDGVQFAWSNLTETGVEEYKLERSADGNDFSEIGYLKPVKNDGGAASYSLFDSSPLAGWNFYRLNTTEQGGISNYSELIKVNFQKSNGGFMIFPNPVKGQEMTVRLGDLPRGSYRLYISNLAGQVLYSRQINMGSDSQFQTIPLGGYKAGTYVVGLVGLVKRQELLIKE